MSQNKSKTLQIKSFFGIDIVDTDYNNFVNFLTSSPKSRLPINIMSINLTALRRYNNESEFFLRSFDFTTADGKGLVIFSGLISEKINNHLSIPRICDRMIKYCHQNDKKLYLLGAKKEVNNKALSKIRKKYPMIRINGYHGYFELDEMTSVENDIMSFKPDVIMVGISSPKKERVILKICNKYKNSINIACGGYIDIQGGKIKQAPNYMHHSGTEWLYRFIQEPRRMLKPMLYSGLFFLFCILPKSLIAKYIHNDDPSLNDILNIN